jgi:hypothetical protein
MRGRIWTDAENETLREMLGKFTLDVIADSLGWSRNSVSKQTVVLGLREKRCTPKMEAAQKARKNAAISARVYEPKYTDKERGLMEAGIRLQNLPMMGVCRVS